MLALGALLDLTELAVEDVLPLPAFAIRRPELLAGMADVEGVGQCLVLDGTALLAESELLSLASVNTLVGGTAAPPATTGTGGPAGTGSTGEDQAGAVGAAPAYLTYSTGGVVVATPLEQIVEILPFPATSVPTTVGDGVLGLVVHRRTAMPVLSLATLLGRAEAAHEVTPASCLLLVAVDGDHLAFAVDGLHAIDQLSWSDADSPKGRPYDDLAGVLEQSPLVRVGEGTRLLPDLDLQALARGVRGPVAARVPRQAAPLDDVPAAPADPAQAAVD